MRSFSSHICAKRSTNRHTPLQQSTNCLQNSLSFVMLSLTLLEKSSHGSCSSQICSSSTKVSYCWRAAIKYWRVFSYVWDLGPQCLRNFLISYMREDIPLGWQQCLNWSCIFISKEHIYNCISTSLGIIFTFHTYFKNVASWVIAEGWLPSNVGHLFYHSRVHLLGYPRIFSKSIEWYISWNSNSAMIPSLEKSL